MAEEPKGDALDVEKPTLDGVKPEEPQKAEAPTNEAALQQLKQVLDSHEFTTVDAIEGLIKDVPYSPKFGESQNQVGELRRQLATVQTELDALRQTPRYQPPPQPDEYGNYPQPPPAPINIKQELKGVLVEVLEEQQRIQREGQEAYARTMTDLQSRPNWAQIEPHFTKVLGNPGVRDALQRGQTSLSDIYSRLNERFLVKTFNEAIGNLPKDEKMVQPGYDVSTGDRLNAPPNAEQEKKEKVSKGVERKDVDAVISALIPDDDPLLRY